LWVHELAKFRDHSNSSTHQTTTIKFINYKASLNNSVVKEIHGQLAIEINKNQDYVKGLFDTVLFCLGNGLAFRGANKEKGNFIDMLEYGKKDLIQPYKLADGP
jgi:hypothetical protein